MFMMEKKDEPIPEEKKMEIGINGKKRVKRQRKQREKRSSQARSKRRKFNERTENVKTQTRACV